MSFAPFEQLLRLSKAFLFAYLKGKLKMASVHIKQQPNLNELVLPGGTLKNKSDNDLVQGNDELEINRVKIDYNVQMNERKREILNKINELGRKLIKHELKEAMLDSIINNTYTELDNLSANEFTRKGQKQTVLIKQMEALSILHDTLMKYEDMIQKYQKIILDIENNKLNSYLKIANLKKEETKADDGIQGILIELQDMIKGGGTASGNPLLDDIQRELDDADY